MNYRQLEIWELARQLSIDVHKMTLASLPRFEQFEEAAQIRRSVKSVRSNIVEGYGRRRYKKEFIKHLVYALASCDETTDHLETLYETNSLAQRTTFDELAGRLDTLGRKLNKFLQSVEAGHRSPK